MNDADRVASESASNAFLAQRAMSKINNANRSANDHLAQQAAFAARTASLCADRVLAVEAASMANSHQFLTDLAKSLIRQIQYITYSMYSERWGERIITAETEIQDLKRQVDYLRNQLKYLKEFNDDVFNGKAGPVREPGVLGPFGPQVLETPEIHGECVIYRQVFDCYLGQHGYSNIEKCEYVGSLIHSLVMSHLDRIFTKKQEKLNTLKEELQKKKQDLEGQVKHLIHTQLRTDRRIPTGLLTRFKCHH
jgi:hypothetical protein